MTVRQSNLFYVALIVGVLSFASSFSRTSSGQPGGIQAGEGRYRTTATSAANLGFVFVTDSVTGQTWWCATNGAQWIDLGKPTAPAAR